MKLSLFCYLYRFFILLFCISIMILLLYFDNFDELFFVEFKSAGFFLEDLIFWKEFFDFLGIKFSRFKILIFSIFLFRILKQRFMSICKIDFLDDNKKDIIDFIFWLSCFFSLFIVNIDIYCSVDFFLYMYIFMYIFMFFLIINSYLIILNKNKNINLELFPVYKWNYFKNFISNMYIYFFFMLFFLLIFSTLNYILLFIFNYYNNDGYIVLSSIFCDIYKILTLE